MNNKNANNDTDQPVTLVNEANSDAAVFAAGAPAATSVNISPGAHLVSSGIKLNNEIFLKGT